MDVKTPKYLDDDYACVGRAIKDESSAYQVLYDRYKHRIYQYIRLRIDNKDDASELTSNTFDKAFHKLKTLKQPQYFRQWLFKIAINEIKMYHRSHATKIETTSIEDMPEHELANHPADNPISDSVKWTINQLKPPEQDILNYRLLQKKEIAEIAKLTGKNIDAVNYLLKKARKNFTKIYLKKYKLGPEKKAGDENEKV